MVVLYVYQGDWPKNATRVAKQTRSLADAGHRVVLLAGNPNRTARREPGPWLEVHRLPAEQKRLEPGDLVRTDISAAFNNYVANLCRMAVVGEPSPEQLDMYQRLLKVERETCRFMKPGVAACDVWHYCHQAIREVGLEHPLPVGTMIGHSIGLNIHEDPMILPSYTTELQANMVINLEPVVGQAFYQIQDHYLLTDSGSQLLSDKFNTDEMYIIE